MGSYDVLNDDIQTKENKTQMKQRLSKEEYAKKMKETRKALFSRVNEQTLIAVSDEKNYLNYLTLQATLGYTVPNTMLVMAQQPEATKVKDFMHWKEDGVSLKKGAKGIQILEPSGEFKRRDGSVGTNYNPKYVFDISQTTDEIISSMAQYETTDLVKAVTYKTDIVPEVVSKNSTLPRDVYFDPSQKKIYVKEKLLPEVLLKGLIREYCLAETGDRSDSAVSFNVDSATYMIMKKYGVDVADVSFAKHCRDYFKGKEDYTVKKELSYIKSLFDKVSERMDNGLYVREQEKEKRHKTNREAR